MEAVTSTPPVWNTPVLFGVKSIETRVLSSSSLRASWIVAETSKFLVAEAAETSAEVGKHRKSPVRIPSETKTKDNDKALRASEPIYIYIYIYISIARGVV